MSSSNTESKAEPPTDAIDYKALLEKGRNERVQDFLLKIRFKEHVAAGNSNMSIAASYFEMHFKDSGLAFETIAARLGQLGVGCRHIRPEDEAAYVYLYVLE